MGIWRSTLTTVKHLVEQHNYEEARDLLRRHIDEEHQVDNDITELHRVLAAYQQFLVMANRVLQDPLNYSGETHTKHDLLISQLSSADMLLDEFELKVKRLQAERKLEA